jgi:putative addiction module killer protein
MIEVRQTVDFGTWWRGLRDRLAQRRIADRIARIQGGLLGDVKRFDGLIEFRIDHGPGYRLYAVQRGEALIILMCGGDKSSQERDIRNARALASQLGADELE